MWLALYQSANIWLCRGPTGPQQATSPQVQMGGRSIASRMPTAATSRTRAAAPARARWVMGDRLSRAVALAKHGRSPEACVQAARLWSRLRRKPGSVRRWQHPEDGDVDRPRGADPRGGEAGRALHRPQRADRSRDGGNRAVEPPL